MSRASLETFNQGARQHWQSMHVLMKFLVNVRIKPADVYRRLQVQYVIETFIRSKAFEWCKRFKDVYPRMVQTRRHIFLYRNCQSLVTRWDKSINVEGEISISMYQGSI